MQYEVTIKLLIKTCVDEDRLMHQIESLFAIGTVRESFSDALKLDVDPHFLNVAVLTASARATTAE
jgi:hypothetical protein